MDGSKGNTIRVFSYLGQRHILEEEEKHFKESATEIAFKNEFAR